MRTGRPRSVSDDAIFRGVSAVVNDAGPAGLTLGAVGDRVGLSAPALTQRFGSKRGLLLAYAEAAATGVDEMFARVEKATPSPLGALRAVLLEFTAGIDSRRSIANNLAFLHLDLTDSELRTHAAKQSRLLRRGITRLIEEAIESGEIRATNPSELADTIYTVYNGALLGWAIDGKGSLARWLSERLNRILDGHRLGAAAPSERGRTTS